MIYIVTILFTIAFVFYSKYQFEEQRTKIYNGKWHPWGMAMRILFFAGLILYKFFPFDWWDVLLSGVINVILFEIGINVVALHVKWNYNGTTSAIDMKVGKVKWYVYAISLVAAIVLKTFKKKS